MRVLSLLLQLMVYLILQFDFVGTEARVKFNGDCLKQEKITFNDGKMVNIYIVYEIERSVNISSFQH